MTSILNKTGNKMKTFRVFLPCLYTLSLIILSAGGNKLFAADDEANTAAAADLVQQANARLQEASSPQDFAAAALFGEGRQAGPDGSGCPPEALLAYIDRLHEPRRAYPHLAEVARKRPDDVNARKPSGMACSQTGRNRKAIEELLAARPRFNPTIFDSGQPRLRPRPCRKTQRSVGDNVCRDFESGSRRCRCAFR